MASINVNCCIVLLLILSHQACTLVRHKRQMPGPDISALKDDGEPLEDSDDFLPAVMVAIQYYTEMMQYDIIQVTTTQKPTKRPTTTTTTTTRRTTQRPTSTTRRTTKRPTTTVQRTTTQRTTTTHRTTTQRTTTQRLTTQRPTTQRPTWQQSTTSRPTWQSTTSRPPYQPTTGKPSTTPAYIIYQTFKPHQPGVQAPERPPYYIYFNIPIKPEQSYYHRPGIQQQTQTGVTQIGQPDWKNPEFFSWFFQKKPAENDDFDENELQYLDVLPKQLLIDIQRDFKRRPAILDYDNVVEFRKIFDDSYNYRYKVATPTNEQMKMSMKIQMQQQKTMLTGKKKPPPTRPYVLMLMLYDLLKKEAKNKKLHQYGGFSEEMLRKLHASSLYTGAYQMTYLFEQLLARNEITVADILGRINVILTDLKNDKSETYKVLTLIPPLAFVP